MCGECAHQPEAPTSEATQVFSHNDKLIHLFAHLDHLSCPTRFATPFAAASSLVCCVLLVYALVTLLGSVGMQSRGIQHKTCVAVVVVGVVDAGGKRTYCDNCAGGC